ncbi:cysteine hydrolase [Povalibacter sp.]|uniref:cysteine hydrolase family protein n=1 Tax=Povalibacter sp. TaxID=1962978 RepID=UPI002F40C275
MKGKRGRATTALIILDLISEFRFQHAERLLPVAKRIAAPVARLKARAKAAGLPVIYVNDTAGKWESDQGSFVSRCLADDARGREIVKRVIPDVDEYFIFKPRHSGFYATPFQELLERLAVKELILVGLTTHQCVLFTAVDAHVREFKLIVPSDCVGAFSSEESRHALFILRRSIKARTPKSTSLVLR